MYDIRAVQGNKTLVCLPGRIFTTIKDQKCNGDDGGGAFKQLTLPGVIGSLQDFSIFQMRLTLSACLHTTLAVGWADDPKSYSTNQQNY